MIMNYRTEAPQILRDFLVYHETIQGHSKKTTDEYFLDLRSFFRYIIASKSNLEICIEVVDQQSIQLVDLALVQSITLTDIYGYMSYLSRDRGLNNASRARKVSTIRSFFKFLTIKAKLLKENPVQDLDTPKIKKSLPRYLALEESIQLLSAVGGKHQVRDYCMLILFLNCGLRVSELVGLNFSDIRQDHLRVLGKGNKERIVYLNTACQAALDDHFMLRNSVQTLEKNALFLSQQRSRITVRTVELLVKKHLKNAGLDAEKYSPHKLRHTAATLMLQNGVDVRTLQEILGHDNLNTTQIYTHVDNANLRDAMQANPLAKIRPKKK